MKTHLRAFFIGILTCALPCVLRGDGLTNRLGDIEIINHLDKCLSLSKTRVEVSGRVTKLVADATLRSNVGNCGCTSARLAYTVFDRTEVSGRSMELHRNSGVLVAPMTAGAHKSFEIVIGGDLKVPVNGTICVRLSCN